MQVGGCRGEAKVENLAKVIVESAHLLGQILMHFSSSQANADPGNQMSAASTIASILTNGASFLGQFSLEIAKFIH
jgi:hypothetical protein